MPPRRRVSAHEKRIVGARFGWRCADCGHLVDETFECDHKVPLWAGGDDTLDALQCLCAGCHRRKTIREEADRLRARQRASSSSTRPALVCTRCERFLSPYFLHRCE